MERQGDQIIFDKSDHARYKLVLPQEMPVDAALAYADDATIEAERLDAQTFDSRVGADDIPDPILERLDNVRTVRVTELMRFARGVYGLCTEELMARMFKAESID